MFSNPHNYHPQQNCLFCCCSIYYFQQKENYLTPPQILFACNKHLKGEIINELNCNHLISVAGKFCQECYAIVEQLFSLNTHLEKIQENITDLGSRLTERISKERKKFELTRNSSQDNTGYYNPHVSTLNNDSCGSCDNSTPKNATRIETKSQPDSKSKTFNGTFVGNGEAPTFPQSSISLTDSKLKRLRPAILQRQIKNDVVDDFKCSKCNKKFSRLVFLDRHDCSEPTIECEVCGKSFAGTKSLKLHLKWHSGDNSHKCEKCRKCFPLKNLLAAHELTHAEDGPFKCEKCGKIFVFKGYYKKHLKKHENPKEMVKFTCNICDKSFNLKSIYQNHLLFHKGEKTFICDMCAKGFYFKRNLTEHIRTHSEEKPYKCEYCEKGFRVRWKCKSHMESKHLEKKENGKKHKCEECGKKYVSKKSFEYHKATHKEEKPYKCQLCDKTFVHPSALKSHTLVHSEEKPFACDTCGKSYRIKSQLTKHKITHSDPGPFVCEICSKAFPFSHGLKGHMVNIHGEKKYACETCGKSFAFNSQLATHLKSHTDSPLMYNFKCDKCYNTFLNARSLQRHLKHHDNYDDRINRIYACVICQKDFPSKLSLCIHQRIHTVNKLEYACEKCHKIFPSEKEKMQHLTEQRADKSIILQCHFCLETFDYNCKFLYHSLKSHPKKQPLLKCTICEIAYTSYAFLRNHVQERHENTLPGKPSGSKTVSVANKNPFGKIEIKIDTIEQNDEKDFEIYTVSDESANGESDNSEVSSHESHEISSGEGPKSRLKKCKKNCRKNDVTKRVKKKDSHNSVSDEDESEQIVISESNEESTDDDKESVIEVRVKVEVSD